MTEHDDLSLLSGAYALDALDPEEKAAYEALLARSQNARTEADGMSNTAVLLGMATKPVDPSPELKARLMASLASTPQLGAIHQGHTAAPVAGSQPQTHGLSAVPRTDAVPSVTQATSVSADPASTRAERSARSVWFARPLGIALAAAAAVVVFFVGAIAGAGVSTNQDTDATTFAQISAAADSQQQVAPVEGGGDATLVYSNELDRSAIVIDRLPELAAGEVFQLWYIDSSGAQSAGTFTPADSGRTLRVLEGAMAEKDIVGITVEPAGGSSKPTTDPITVIESA